MSFLQMSLHGAVMIAVITILRALTLNQVPKKTFLVLWALALMRLLVPFSLPSRLSVYTLLGASGTCGIVPPPSLLRRVLPGGTRHRHAAGHCAFRVDGLAVGSRLACGH